MSQSEPNDQVDDTLSVVSKSMWALIGGFVAAGIAMFAVLLLVMWSFL